MLEVDPRVESVLKQMDWLDEYDRHLNLEMYKFVSSDDLINHYLETGIIVERISELGGSEPTFNASDVSDIEISRNCIIRATEDLYYLVYCTPGNQIDEDYIKAALSIEGIRITYVTPYNFSLLRNESLHMEPTVIMKRLVLEGIELNATDIHLEVKMYEDCIDYPVEFRIGNRVKRCDLFELNEKTQAELIHATISLLTSAELGDIKLPGGIKTSSLDLFGDGKVSIRIAVSSVIGGYWAVCRIQTAKTVGMAISALGFGPEATIELDNIVKKGNGLSLFAGEMRTGKNTTIFAIAAEMAKRSISIAEFSSPPEFRMPFPQMDYKDKVDVLQRELALVKKKDLDVAIINEIPDVPTALAARELVGSSVHILTTFHINRVWHLPYKLYEFYGEHYKDIFSQLNICVTHKMYERLCNHDNTRKHTIVGLPYKYRSVLEKHGVANHYVDDGCPICKEQGWSGELRPLVEWFTMNDDLYSMLMKVNHVYEMEEIIKKHVKSQHHDLETQVCRAIGEGKVAVEALDSLS